MELALFKVVKPMKLEFKLIEQLFKQNWGLLICFSTVGILSGFELLKVFVNSLQGHLNAIFISEMCLKIDCFGQNFKGTLLDDLAENLESMSKKAIVYSCDTIGSAVNNFRFYGWDLIKLLWVDFHLSQLSLSFKHPSPHILEHPDDLSVDNLLHMHRAFDDEVWKCKDAVFDNF